MPAPRTDPAQLFQAVSDPTRLRLLRLLRREELNVQELVALLKMNQPRISKHLGVLRDAGWIAQRKEGTHSWYRSVPPAEFRGGRALCEEVTTVADRSAGAARDDAALAAVLADREAVARDLFAGVAADWDRIRGQYEHHDIQLGAIAALVDRRLRVLDIGTGTGALLPLLAGAAGAVVAVDNSPAMLARARRLCRRDGLANVTLQRADIQALPFAAASFDAVYCAMVLHHVPQPAAAVTEMARVVRPGGKLIVIAFTRHELVWLREEMAHRWLGFTRETVAGMFAEAGLRPTHYLRRGRVTAEATRSGRSPRQKRWRWPDVFLAVAEKPIDTAT